MNKEQRAIITEYAATLPDDELRWIAARLKERLRDDVSDALCALAKNAKVDQVLASANSAWDLYDLCDKSREVLVKECNRRGLTLKWVAS